MKKQIVYILAFVLLLTNGTPAFSQQKLPFKAQIDAFLVQDSLNFPPKDAILLVGSSSFTNWKDVQEYFPKHKIINRGFGGSSLPDVIRYAPNIIYPYKPAQVLIYCGENDFPSGINTTADTIFNRFTRLHGMIRSALPKTEIIYISMKPSVSRLKYLPEMRRANEMIRKFQKKHRRSGYIDVYSKMILADGSPMPDIFLKDQLHMNKNGYLIWQKAIKPYLKK
ncbi:MAG: GDSL-type esterase/lipase family protein [Daejeonella sp.]|uniref:GDSL-type esterase/lipase family protein n=1 Tax=Daejeonella sp. TaxID=2805397 RepID=UPI0027356B48|nr:GDSL-type esterase/lipase family protein [Daejeonella sp.]MDP3468231.1 GDSL-type esterase/lipase family protein [Daejeonella sp.]